MSIVVKKKGEAAEKVVQSLVSQEKDLQEYIHKNPEAIPLDDIRDNLKLLVIAREFPTPSGPIDALAIDNEGSVYIIETKLYKNTDRRLVVAQVMDYGAGLWNKCIKDYSEIERDIEKAISQTLRQKLIDFFGIDEQDVDGVLAQVRANFNTGSFIFIVLMDKLHDSFKDLINFINANSNFRLLGCEIEFYRHEDLEILIPKLYGAEIKKTLSSSSPAARKKWDELTFFDDLSIQFGKSTEAKIRELYDYAQRTANKISWGTGAVSGSFSPKYDKISARSLFTVFSNAVLQINFGWLSDNESTLDFRKKLRVTLAESAGLTFPSDYEEKYPTFPAPQWIDKVPAIINGLSKLLEKTSSKAE